MFIKKSSSTLVCNIFFVFIWIFIFTLTFFFVGCKTDPKQENLEFVQKISNNSQVIKELIEELNQSYSRAINTNEPGQRKLKDKILNIEKLIPVLIEEIKFWKVPNSPQARELLNLHIKQLELFKNDFLPRYLKIQKILESADVKSADKLDECKSILVEIENISLETDDFKKAIALLVNGTHVASEVSNLNTRSEEKQQ